MAYYVVRVSNTVTQSNYITSNDGIVVYANALTQSYIYASGSNQPMVFMNQSEAIKVVNGFGLRDNSNVKLIPWTSSSLPGALFSKSFQRSWTYMPNWTPSILNPLIWLDASNTATITKDGSNKVSAWANQGSVGGSFSQGTAATQPVWSNSDLGYPGIRHSLNQWLDMAAPASPSGFDFVFVFRRRIDPPAGTADSGIWNFTSAPLIDNTHIPFFDGNIYDSTGTTARKNTGVNPVTDMSIANVVYEVVSTTSEWTDYLNWAQLYTTPTNTPGWGGTLRVGANQDGTITYDGVFREILVFSSKLSTADRNSLKAYLTNKWGTP